MSEVTERFWRPGDEVKTGGQSRHLQDAESFKIIEGSIDKLSEDLRGLSLDLAGMQKMLEILARADSASSSS